MTAPADKDDARLELVRKFAAIVRDSVVSARREVMGDDHAARLDALSGYLESMETEAAPLTARLFSKYLGDPSVSDELRGLFGQMSDPEHQWDAILQFIGLFG